MAMAVEEKGASKMPIEFINKLGAIVFIVAGLLLAMFHKRMAKFCVMMWRRHCRLNPPSEVGYQIGFLTGGIIFLVCGFLTLLGILK